MEAVETVGVTLDPAGLGTFFTDSWRIYQKILQHNHMHHRELYALVRQELLKRGTGLEILDLGCGDGTYMAQALTEIPFTSYTGVDLSPVALTLAAENFAPLLGPHQFITANFVDYLAECQTDFNFILISFALHHLSFAAKGELLAQIKRCLRPGGVFVLVDVFREPDEDLPTYYDRYLAQARRNEWQLTPAEFSSLTAHITSCDFPDAPDDLIGLAQTAGLHQPELRFLHPETTIGLITFQTAAV